MATITVFQGESNRAVTGAAVFPLEDFRHGIVGKSFLTVEKIRMAEFAAVPDRVLAVRENDVRHPVDLRLESEIALNLHPRLLDGDPFQLIDQFERTGFLRFLPVYAVTERLLGHFFQELVE